MFTFGNNNTMLIGANLSNEPKLGTIVTMVGRDVMLYDAPSAKLYDSTLIREVLAYDKFYRLYSSTLRTDTLTYHRPIRLYSSTLRTDTLTYNRPIRLYSSTLRVDVLCSDAF